MITFTTSSGATYTLDATTSTILYWNPAHPAGAAPILYQNVQLRHTPRIGRPLEFGFHNRGEAVNPARMPRIMSSVVDAIRFA